MVGLDADDTLWHNEPLFTSRREQFCALLSRYEPKGIPEDVLYSVEMRNLRHFGYGVKGFVLSMIETAIEMTGGRVESDDVRQIIGWGREMLATPTQLLDGVAEAIETLAQNHRLVLVTKGDLLDQETKLARSGLGDFFTDVSVVSRKDRATYEGLVAGRGLDPAEFLMVGNSLRSDVVPVAEMGGHAVHIPYTETWAHEKVDAARLTSVRYHTLPRIHDLPELVRGLP